MNSSASSSSGSERRRQASSESGSATTTISGWLIGDSQLRRRAVALLDHPVAAADDLAGPAEEPPHLPRLEDLVGLRRRARLGARRRGEYSGSMNASGDPARDHAARASAPPAAPAAPARWRAPPTPCWRSRARAARRPSRGARAAPRAPRPAHSAAPSSSSGWPMSSARSVIGLAAHSRTHDRHSAAAGAAGEQARGEHDAQRGAGQQAWSRRKRPGTASPSCSTRSRNAWVMRPRDSS